MANSDFELGKKIFQQRCAVCHGADGESYADMDFIVNPRNLQKSILTEEQTYKIIKYSPEYFGSFANIMPAFKDILSEKEIRAVAHYIHQNFNKDVENRIEKLYKESKPIPKDKIKKMAKRGRKIYFRNCMWCHGIEGRGDGEATKKPKNSIFPYNLRRTLLTQKQIFLYTKYGAKFWGGRRDTMPAWKVKYDDFTLKSVAKYVYENIVGKDLK